MSDRLDLGRAAGRFPGPHDFDVELSSYDYVKVLAYDPSAAEEYPIRHWVIELLADEVDAAGHCGAQGDMELKIGNRTRFSRSTRAIPSELER